MGSGSPYTTWGPLSQPGESMLTQTIKDEEAFLHLSAFNSNLAFLSAVASQSEAMGAGLEQCIVGHPASVTIVTRDKSGGACKIGNAILSAEVRFTLPLR